MAQQRRDLETIEKIIIHCSDSDNPWHDNIETIRQWHKEFGFDDIGYHHFIPKIKLYPDTGRPLEIVGAHCLGHNRDSVGICLSGKERFNEIQFVVASILCENLAKQLGWKNLKDRIFPHNYFNKFKTCPNFPIEKITEMIDYP